MGPFAYLDFFARIRMGPRTHGVRMIRAGVRCGVCEKRLGLLPAARTRGEPDSRLLCRSCFGLMLKAAEQSSLTDQEVAPDSVIDADERFA